VKRVNAGWVSRLGRAVAPGLWFAPAAVVVLIAVAGPLLAPHQPGTSIGAPLAGPADPLAAGAPWGTDLLGRDVFSQVLHGGRPVVLLPVLAAVLATAGGTAAGLLLGWFGGIAVRGVTRALELLLVLPPVVVLLTMLHATGGGPVALTLLVVLLGVPFTARVVAAATAPLRRAGYVEAALALGDTVPTVLRREVLPVLLPTVLTDLGLRVVSAVYLVSAAGVLGFGSSPPATDWATQLQQNLEGAGLNPLATVVPTVLIAGFCISVSLGLDRVAGRYQLRPGGHG
jgi:peptide/nickel transport system permease protein